MLYGVEKKKSIWELESGGKNVRKKGNAADNPSPIFFLPAAKMDEIEVSIS